MTSFIQGYPRTSESLMRLKFQSGILLHQLPFGGLVPVVLYGCAAWSLTLREKRRLRVFENRIPRRIFGPKRDENGEWRRVIKSRRLRWAGHEARMVEGRGAFKILTGKPTGLGVDGRTILEWTLKR